MSEELAETPEIEVATTETPEPSTEAVKTDDAPQADAGEAEAAKEQPKELSEVEKVKYAMQKRIDRLTAKAAELERSHIDAVEKLKQFEQPKSNAPREEDFETTEDYLKALGKHEAQQEIEAQKKAEAEANKNKAYEEKIAAKKAAFEAQEAEIRKVTPDYDETVQVLNEFVSTVNTQTQEFQVFRDVLMDSKNMPALSYELGKNPDLMDNLSKMSPVEIARTLFRMEYDIENRAKPQIQTQPAPPKPVSSTQKAHKSMDTKSGKEILEWAGIKY